MARLSCPRPKLMHTCHQFAYWLLMGRAGKQKQKKRERNDLVPVSEGRGRRSACVPYWMHRLIIILRQPWDRNHFFLGHEFVRVNGFQSAARVVLGIDGSACAEASVK